MKNYIEYEITRRKVQLLICLGQCVLITSAIVFMLLFVTTQEPSVGTFGALAILFTGICIAYYLAQLIFACLTHKKISQRNKLDTMFLLTSILFLPVGAAICGISILFV